MRPGAWTSGGFLRVEDSLDAVLAADARRVLELGADVRTLGQRLSSLIDAAEGSDVARPSRVGSLDVEIHRQRGLIACPWAPDEGLACGSGGTGVATANRFVIVDPQSGARVEGFALTAHMIEEHGFFGGPGTPFRIDPERLVGVLDGPAREDQ